VGELGWDLGGSLVVVPRIAEAKRRYGKWETGANCKTSAPIIH